MIKKYFAKRDASIAYAFDSYGANLRESGNTGASDVLETYALFNRLGQSSTENELSRIVVQFEHAEIQSDITKALYDLTRAKFYLRLFNVAHGETVPRSFTLQLFLLTRAWDEGEGLDMEDYGDEGGVCWLNAQDSTPWALPGGDYDLSTIKTYSFETGTEDLELDISDWVATWLDGSRTNYGILLKMADETSEESHYTKRFSARKSHYFFQRPIIEVRFAAPDTEYSTDWRDEITGRKEFYFSSPIASVTDNTNQVFYYNYVRGQLKDIPGYGDGELPLYVKVMDSQKQSYVAGSLIPLTASWVRTGVYRVDLSLAGDAAVNPTLFDQWFLDALCTIRIYEGEITTINHDTSVSSSTEVKYEYDKNYVIKIKDMSPAYRNDELIRFRTFIREKDWKPNVYVSYTSDHTSGKVILDDLYYKIKRLDDDEIVVNYSYLASVNYSRVCFDKVSNYFDIDMTIFEPDFAYAIQFAYQTDGKYVELPDIFKFRVKDVGLYEFLEG